MLANKLDKYKVRGNSYVNKNIQEIQELYMNEEQQKERLKKKKLFNQAIQGFQLNILINKKFKFCKQGSQ